MDIPYYSESPEDPADYLPSKVGILDPMIAYFGTEGSYTEEAALDYFGTENHFQPHSSASSVFKALQEEDADYGVLPIENSTTGSIAEVYDLLAEYKMFIVGETKIKIEHCLLGIPGSEVENLEEVYSHPQGFAQAEPFLARYPHLKLLAYHNTAIAAKHVAAAGDIRLAAIASRRAAERYGLSVLAENINDQEQNTTRFIVVSKETENRCANEKYSILFRLTHTAGSLYDALGVFKKHGLNLVKIESRPIPNTPWEYLFFLDFTGTVNTLELTKLLDDIADKTESFHFLGNYAPCEPACPGDKT